MSGKRSPLYSRILDFCFQLSVFSCVMFSVWCLPRNPIQGLAHAKHALCHLALAPACAVADSWRQIEVLDATDWHKPMQSEYCHPCAVPWAQPGNPSPCMCSLLLPQKRRKAPSQRLCRLRPAHFAALGNTPVFCVNCLASQGSADWWNVNSTYSWRSVVRWICTNLAILPGNQNSVRGTKEGLVSSQLEP